MGSLWLLGDDLTLLASSGWQDMNVGPPGRCACPLTTQPPPPPVPVLGIQSRLECAAVVGHVSIEKEKYLENRI